LWLFAAAVPLAARTSENPSLVKFAERAFHELR
jgi:hypothetical protein